jgi:hypothetical protein
VGDDGLDAEKLQTLAHWAAGLRTDERAEVSAAGRALEMLIDEVERLHVLLWDRRLFPGGDADEPPPALDRTLRDRLRLRRRSLGNPHA